jgi:hypothetical protein
MQARRVFCEAKLHPYDLIVSPNIPMRFRAATFANQNPSYAGRHISFCMNEEARQRSQTTSRLCSSIAIVHCGDDGHPVWRQGVKCGTGAESDGPRAIGESIAGS